MVRIQPEGEAVFATIKGELYRTQQTKMVRPSWISQKIWRLVDRRTALQREERDSAREASQARSDFQPSLQEDRRQHVQEARKYIEAIMESRNIREAWDRILQW